ncbi:MAG: hypothetical protein AAF616_11330 [Bacteroidota bacterium]
MKELQKLSESDQSNILSVIDAFVRDAKLSKRIHKKAQAKA